MSGAVMAASPQGGAGWPGQQAAGLRVQALSVLGKISPVWVPEGDPNLTGRRGSSDRFSQLLICVCPGDAFLFE
jgi:hypothetical protein